MSFDFSCFHHSADTILSGYITENSVLILLLLLIEQKVNNVKIFQTSSDS